MINRLPAWLFMGLALVLIGIGEYPLVRFSLSLDEQIMMPAFTVAMMLIGGLMCGLTAMILLVRRQTPIHYPDQTKANSSIQRPLVKSASAKNSAITRKATLLHASGLLLISGLPLANFLVCYLFWVKYRRQSSVLDQHGINALNFQISIYLYLLMSLFLVFVMLGLFTTPLLICLHLIATLIACVQAFRGKLFRYPANIPIIQGRPASKA